MSDEVISSEEVVTEVENTELEPEELDEDVPEPEETPEVDGSTDFSIENQEAVESEAPPLAMTLPRGSVLGIAVGENLEAEEIDASISPPQRGRARASTLVRLTRGLQIGKQFIREVVKPKSVQKTAFPEKFMMQLNAFSWTKTEVEMLLLDAKKLLQATDSELMAEASFSSSLAKLGSHCKADPEASQIVQSYVPYTLRLQTARRQHFNAFKTLIYGPLNEIWTTEIAKAQMMMRTLENNRLLLDSCKRRMSASKEQKAKNTATRQTQEAGVVFNKCMEHLSELLDVIEVRKAAILKNYLADFVKAQHKYFEAADEIVQTSQLSADIEDPEDQLM